MAQIYFSSNYLIDFDIRISLRTKKRCSMLYFYSKVCPRFALGNMPEKYLWTLLFFDRICRKKEKWAKGPITNGMPNLWANILIMGHLSFIHGPKAQL